MEPDVQDPATVAYPKSGNTLELNTTRLLGRAEYPSRSGAWYRQNHLRDSASLLLLRVPSLI